MNEALSSRSSFSGDVAALESALRESIRGEVRFDRGSRALYATDASNYRQVPIGVVVPRDVDDVVAAVEISRRYRAPVLARGGGTSLAGQCCNVAVVLDFSKFMNRILELDPERRIARVEPGVVLDTLRDAAEVHGLTFGPDPATHSRCTIGGMIGNNSCGVHSIMSGKTDVNVEEMEILTYDGVRMRVGATPDDVLDRILAGGNRRAEIYHSLRAIRDRYATLVRQRFPKIPRNVSGYNLEQLLPENGFHVARALVGTESTCALVLEATLKLVPSPPFRQLVVLGYTDVFAAADAAAGLLRYGPIGLEGFDDKLVADMRRNHLHEDGIQMLPEGNGWLLVEFGGESPEEAHAKARRMIDSLPGSAEAPRSSRAMASTADASKLWRVRESALGATAVVPGQPRAWEGWEDSAVEPSRLGHYLRDLRALLDRYGYRGNLYGHFGDGCVHTRIDFDLESRQGIGKYRAFVHEAAQLVVRYGGSLSGEHGDGQSRGELLPILFGEEIVEGFRQFKRTWDPDWKMNPGKVVDPYRIDENLRLGADYRPWDPATHFRLPDDEGSLAWASLRCVGVGACRRLGGGTMCPSYMVTREEKHSTRGRARLLWEMLQGEVIRDGWRSAEVHEALDLCLACKGCKSDCPVHVDMATYKAEFLSHYYAWKVRPAAAYTMGWIAMWARVAGIAPFAANAALRMPGASAIFKSLLGIASERQMPRFASRSFRRRFRERERAGSPRVVLWTDTFTNGFEPEIAEAATEVLEAAGWHVAIPSRQFCCGRPLYDWGFLTMAKRWLRAILRGMRDEIAAGTPVVVLEPSCASVFRDELINFFPDDEAARALSSRVMTLAEFLRQHAPAEFQGDVSRTALVQSHCHQKSVLTMEPDREILDRWSVRAEVLDSGCCGMAGAFGFEKKHYEVSVACGERVLLPAVRAANDDTLIIADGFSCREQIRQLTDRTPLHLAQVLRDALPK